MKTHMKFNNMGSNIYGDYVRKNGNTYITKNDLSKAVINFKGDLVIISINGNNHFVEYKKELSDFIDSLNYNGIEFEGDLK